jgi:hypothetical protein
MLRATFALAIFTMLMACTGTITQQVSQNSQTLHNAAIPQAQSDVDIFARNYLDTIQARSVADSREFCGYFFRDTAGRIHASPPRRGTFSGCRMPEPSRDSSVFASYHTHGAYGPRYDREVPSPLDLLADFALGLDGYISTPGGRVWHVNKITQDARQVCGLDCVTADPQFVPRNEANVRQRYTVATLTQRGGGWD